MPDAFLPKEEAETIDTNTPLVVDGVVQPPPELKFFKVRNTEFFCRRFRLTGLWYVSVHGQMIAMSRHEPDEKRLWEIAIDWIEATTNPKTYRQPLLEMMT